MRTIGDQVYRKLVIAAESIGPETFLLERDPIPFPHYRYLDREFCEAFFYDGSLRLGTIFGYAKQGDYQGFRFDENEGIISFFTDETDLWDIDVPVRYSSNCHNAYTLCASKHLARDTANLFKANSCVAIQSLEFYVEISKIVNNIVSHIGSLSTIQYTSKNAMARHILDNRLEELPATDAVKHMPPIARTKLLKHSREHEVRAIWEPVSAQADKNRSPYGQLIAEESYTEFFGKRVQENTLLGNLNIKVPEARKFAKPIYW